MSSSSAVLSMMSSSAEVGLTLVGPARRRDPLAGRRASLSEGDVARHQHDPTRRYAARNAENGCACGAIPSHGSRKGRYHGTNCRVMPIGRSHVLSVDLSPLLFVILFPLFFAALWLAITALLALPSGW